MSEILRPCSYCDNEFTVTKPSDPKKYCSKNCFYASKTISKVHLACKQCGSTDLKKYNKFCSKSCSALFNNSCRKPRSEESKNRTRTALIHTPKPPIIHHWSCMTCGATESSTRKKRSGRCSPCQLTFKTSYKRACKFNLNKKDHASLYDSKLIEKHGWFVSAGPKKNRNGMTWDHLYPLHMGFENKIPAEIMNHPANAELVPWPENIRRYREEKAMINYETLLERIKQWNRGDQNLHKFFNQ